MLIAIVEATRHVVACICVRVRVRVRVQYHHNFCDLHPLLLCGVRAGWIMGACVQNKDGVLWATLLETENGTSTVNSQ